jgi:hypothetical protein
MRSNTLTDDDLQALENLTGSSEVTANLTNNGKPKVDIDALEKQAESL